MMDKIIVKGGNVLEGTVKIEGAKNSVLPIITASLIASEGVSVLSDAPTLDDVYTINEVLRNLNAEVNFENNQVTVDATTKLKTEAPFEYVSKMRESILGSGPLVERYGHANVAMPAGSAIAPSPIALPLARIQGRGHESK